MQSSLLTILKTPTEQLLDRLYFSGRKQLKSYKVKIVNEGNSSVLTLSFRKNISEPTNN